MALLTLTPRRSSDVWELLSHLAAQAAGTPHAVVTLDFGDEVLVAGMSPDLAGSVDGALVRAVSADLIDSGIPQIVPNLGPIHGTRRVQSYVAIPVRNPASRVRGSVCVLDVVPRTWDAQVLAELWDVVALGERRLDRSAA